MSIELCVVMAIYNLFALLILQLVIILLIVLIVNFSNTISNLFIK